MSTQLLLPHSPVDPLPQQVGVSAVPGVLLDHVHQHLTQRDRASVVVPGDAEIAVVGHELIGERDLGPPHRPRLGDDLGVGHRAVSVPVAVGLGAEDLRRILTGHHPPALFLFASQVVHVEIASFLVVYSAFAQVLGSAVVVSNTVARSATSRSAMARGTDRPRGRVVPRRPG